MTEQQHEDRILLGVAAPKVPFAEMTDEELDAFAEEFADGLAAALAPAMERVPAPEPAS